MGKALSHNTELTKYDAACRAVAECKSIDEAKDLHDKAAAMAVYARQAKNKDLEADAKAIRMRAIRKLDELRRAQKKTVGLAKGGGGKHGRKRVIEKPTLASQGIDKNLANAGRKLGALSDQQFEQAVDAARQEARAPEKPDRRPRDQLASSLDKAALLKVSKADLTAKTVDELEALISACQSHAAKHQDFDDKDWKRVDVMREVLKQKQKALAALMPQLTKSEPEPTSHKPHGPPNTGDLVADCLAKVVPIIRVGFDLMNAEQRLAFVAELRKAIHTISTEVTQQDVETDRWAETAH